MKNILLIIALLLTLQVNAQDDKTVTLVSSGSGKTQEEAKQNALRSAIEQAFGTFISSKTEILNDSLVKDEIVSVASGNIQKYEIISEVQVPNGDFGTSLKATVSVTKLTSFVESKGVVVEFKGNLFASNIVMQELYEKNEVIGFENLGEILRNIAKVSFDFKIDANEPIQNENGKWDILLKIGVTANKNFEKIPNVLYETIKNLSMSENEIEDYLKLNKKIYPLTIANSKNKGYFVFRSKSSLLLLIDAIYSLNNSMTNFVIKNGIDEFDLTKFSIKQYMGDPGDEYLDVKINDDNFRVILTNNFRSGGCGIFASSLFHNEVSISGDLEKLNPSIHYKEVYLEKKLYNRNKKTQDAFNVLSEKFLIKKIGWRSGIECCFFTHNSKINPTIENFLPLKKIINSHENSGVVISFANLKYQLPLVQFEIHDIRTIDEIKKISKFEILKK